MNDEREYSVYIIQCNDGSYYTGLTSDLPLRLSQHNSGGFADAYTTISLVYNANFEDVDDAITWERTIKRWSRKKKEALISGDWEKLSHSSKSNIFRSIIPIVTDAREKMNKYVMVSTVEP
jgi:putative endonuclease